MSSIRIVDKRGGTYQAVIEFSYGECERLPFNILRRIRAKITTIPNAGVQASAHFNIRDPRDSAAFVEMLDLFGEDGSYIHGSAANSADLSRTTPPENGGTIYVATEDDDLEIEGSFGEDDKT